MNAIPVDQFTPQVAAVPPPRVQAAQQFLFWFHQGRAMPVMGFDQRPADPPDPTAKEKAAYESALDVMRLYFSGEMDYGDSPPASHIGGDDNPESPAPVPVS